MFAATAAAWGAGPPQAARAEAVRSGCGIVTSWGCCQGERLWWCDKGKARSRDCSDRPRCGWRLRGKGPDGLYDCDTGGSADPALQRTKECLFGDAGPPGRPDAGPPSPCGSVTEEGCCTGASVVYCDGTRRREVRCGQNPYCGWRGTGQVYNCGTPGEADPRGRHARACPEGPPPISPAVTGARDGGAARRVDSGPSSRGCSLVGPRDRAMGLVPLALLLAIAALGRRSGRRGARR
ncbi:MAG: hypothetical protein IT371_17390 [Deltaproteobacteria bacterium]|nr:hypothetical protein [Deltaproteobacteria bacterium]